MAMLLSLGGDWPYKSKENQETIRFSVPCEGCIKFSSSLLLTSEMEFIEFEGKTFLVIRKSRIVGNGWIMSIISPSIGKSAEKSMRSEP